VVLIKIGANCEHKIIVSRAERSDCANQDFPFERLDWFDRGIE